MAGEYNILLEHGLLTNGTNFFSFDYPDSDSSGLRAVNNRSARGDRQSRQVSNRDSTRRCEGETARSGESPRDAIRELMERNLKTE